MKIQVKRRIINQKIKEILRKSKMTQMELSKKTKIHWGTLSAIVNFRKKANEDEKIAIAVGLSIPIDDIFPEEYDELFNQLGKISREKTFELTKLDLADPQIKRLEAPETKIHDFKLREMVERMMDQLDPRERKLLRLRFGFEDGVSKTMREVGQEFGISVERVRQIEMKAVERLKETDEYLILGREMSELGVIEEK